MRGPGSTPGPFAGCVPKRSTSWAATPATSSSDGAAPRLLRHFLTVSVTVTVTSFVTVTGLVTVTTWAGSCTVTTFVWVTVGDGSVTVRETVCVAVGWVSVRETVCRRGRRRYRDKPICCPRLRLRL